MNRKESFMGLHQKTATERLCLSWSEAYIGNTNPSSGLSLGSISNCRHRPMA